MNNVATGLDILRQNEWKKFKGQRLGLLSNQASVDSKLAPGKKIVANRLPGHLKALFGPQHGYGREYQDNMIETEHTFDLDLNIPIFSLYSKSREPLSEMFDLIDVLIIDLQDVGTRVYTYAVTMLNCLKAAAEFHKKIIILDRPNPLGGTIAEGNILKPEFYSFVGPYKLPMRHGLTMAELANIFNNVFQIRAELEFILMKGWCREMIWDNTGIKWVMPSPNMPLPETSYVYPGQVIWEGTNISEGRGTCRPFELFGAPFLKTKLISNRLGAEAKRGCFLQEITFQPTFHKWKNEICNGFMIHIIDHSEYKPFLTSISLLKILYEEYGDEFKWKLPPYEYEYTRMPIDIILGDSSLRTLIEKGEDIECLWEEWNEELNQYLDWRRPYLLYFT